MEKEPTPQFIIREAIQEDAVSVRKMQAASWLATYPNEENGVSYEWVKERTNSWLTTERLEESKNIFAGVITDSTQFFRVAERGGEVVGLVHISTNSGGDSKELEAIYTAPDTFGSGLGQQLMDAASQWIGGAETGLTVASYNERAIRFYEKNGFRVIPGSESIYKDKLPVVRMMRKGEE